MSTSSAVKVTVRSDLSEFATLRLENVQVESPGTQTWSSFLAFYKVGFNPAFHVLKTNRCRVIEPTDTIGKTATWFKRKAFHVHIRNGAAVGAGRSRASAVVAARPVPIPVPVRQEHPGRLLRGASQSRAPMDPPRPQQVEVEDDAMSQDSQDADETNSSMKDRFLSIAAAYSNSNFEQFRDELRTLQRDDDRSRRWENKTPRLANFLNKAFLHGSSNP